MKTKTPLCTSIKGSDTSGLALDMCFPQVTKVQGAAGGISAPAPAMLQLQEGSRTTSSHLSFGVTP